MHASVRRALLGAALALPLAGCEPVAERTSSFGVGADIPLGIMGVTVERWELAARVAPIRALDPPSGEKAIAVWVRWRGLDDFVESARQTFAETVLQHRLRIVDSGGSDYPAITVLEPELYHWTGRPAPAGRSRVVIFWVPAGSEDYTLRLEHPDPGPDEFQIGLIPMY